MQTTFVLIFLEDRENPSKMCKIFNPDTSPSSNRLNFEIQAIRRSPSDSRPISIKITLGFMKIAALGGDFRESQRDFDRNRPRIHKNLIQST